MAKLLGHDIVTSQELKEFEDRVIGGLMSEVASAKAKVDSMKKWYIVGGASLVIIFGLMLYLIIH